MKKYPAAALFDLDGVLVDTEGIYTGIWRNIERRFPTGIEDFALKIKGTTLPSILANFREDERTIIIKMLDEAEERMAYSLFAGVTEFLDELQANGIPSAIVTSSNDRKMENLYASNPGFRERFKVVLTDADVSRSKPDPEGYMKAAALLGADSADCIVFEDSFNGLRAGRAAGGKVVALATTNPRESLEELADTVIDGFEGLTLDALIENL